MVPIDGFLPVSWTAHYRIAARRAEPSARRVG